MRHDGAVFDCHHDHSHDLPWFWTQVTAVAALHGALRILDDCDAQEDKAYSALCAWSVEAADAFGLVEDACGA